MRDNEQDIKESRKYYARIKDKDKTELDRLIDKLYKTSRWGRTRLIVLERDGYRCQDCKREGIYRIGKIIHHVIPAKEFIKDKNNLELFFFIDNLETICYFHHNKEHPEKFFKSTREPKTKPKRSVFKMKATEEASD